MGKFGLIFDQISTLNDLNTLKMLKNHAGISVQTKYQQSLTMQALEIAYLDALSIERVAELVFLAPQPKTTLKVAPTDEFFTNFKKIFDFEVSTNNTLI